MRTDGRELRRILFLSMPELKIIKDRIRVTVEDDRVEIQLKTGALTTESIYVFEQIGTFIYQGKLYHTVMDLIDILCGDIQRYFIMSVISEENLLVEIKQQKESYHEQDV